MIARKNRFHGHKSVTKVRGKPIRLPFFSVYHARTKRTDFRMAVIVGKKTEKSAVKRNRIRRRIFEIVRKSEVLKNKPVDVVFVVHEAKVFSCDHTELEQQINKSLVKIASSL